MTDKNKNSLSQFLIEQSKDPEFIKQHEEEWRNYKFDIPDPIKRSLESHQKLLDSVMWKSQYLEFTDSISQSIGIYDNSNLERIGTLGNAFSCISNPLINSVLERNELMGEISASLGAITESLEASGSMGFSQTSFIDSSISAKDYFFESREQFKTFQEMISPNISYINDTLSGIDISADFSSDEDFKDIKFEDIMVDVKEISQTKDKSKINILLVIKIIKFLNFLLEVYTVFSTLADIILPNATLLEVQQLQTEVANLNREIIQLQSELTEGNEMLQELILINQTQLDILEAVQTSEYYCEINSEMGEELDTNSHDFDHLEEE